jgi:hypothetical protein
MNRFELHDNSSKVTLIVVGSVVGGLLLLLLACGGLVFYGVHRAGQTLGPQLQAQFELQMADGAVQGFLNDLGGGQVDAAYDSTTPAFRAKQTLPQFKKFVERNPLLKKFTTAEHAPVNNAPGARQLTLNYTLNGEGGPLTMTVQVVKEGEEWKVDSVSVP